MNQQTLLAAALLLSEGAEGKGHISKASKTSASAHNVS